MAVGPRYDRVHVRKGGRDATATSPLASDFFLSSQSLIHSFRSDFRLLKRFLSSLSLHRTSTEESDREMADWGPVVIAVILFVLLSPGLLFQLPAKNRVVEFGNMQTSGVSVLVHTIIFLGLISIFLIAIGVHISTG